MSDGDIAEVISIVIMIIIKYRAHTQLSTRCTMVSSGGMDNLLYYSMLRYIVLITQMLSIGNRQCVLYGCRTNYVMIELDLS